MVGNLRNKSHFIKGKSCRGVQRFWVQGSKVKVCGGSSITLNVEQGTLNLELFVLRFNR
jgi:hypothetical protein